MSKKLVAACLAALAFTACEEKKVESSTPTPPPAQARVAQLPVTTAGLVDTKRDGGVSKPKHEVAEVEAPAADTLALAHDTPSVDHLARAKGLAAEGDVKGALAEARRAVFTTPGDEETLTFAARTARRAGRPQLAAEAWGRVALLRADDAAPVIEQARALYQAKDFAGAVLAGRDAIARDAENAEAHHIVGLAQLSMGELKGAIASFERTVQLEPGHGWALNNLGFSYLRANRNEDAVGVLTQAAEKLPHVAYVQNNLGVALERVGRTDEAKQAYQLAMDLSPKYVKARINAARVAKAELDAISSDAMDGADVAPTTDVPVVPVTPAVPEAAHAMPEAPKP